MTGERPFATPRLLVRDWRRDEGDRFFDIYSRWEVARWLGAVPAAMTDRTEADRRIQRWHTLNAERPDGGRWAIERAEDGLVVGTLILAALPDGDGELEVGWHLHPDSWGHGYATEAAAGALRWSFGRGSEEVFAVVRPDNVRSAAVCSRLGMSDLGLTERYYDSELRLFRATPSGVIGDAGRDSLQP